MISVKQTSNAQIFDDIRHFLDDFTDVALDAFVETVADVEPHMLDELQDEPGKPTYPLRWASDKQRKFVMAKLRRENNLPYRRTGKLRMAWQTEINSSDTTFEYRVFNAAPAAPFVYGSLAQNFQVAARFQQPFHADTGWQPASPTVAFWYDALQDEYAKRLEKIAVVEFNRRAGTGTPRRK